MTKENQEKNLLQVIQQIFITWNNGAQGVFVGPAVLTPDEMSELNPKRPKIISVKVGKPMILTKKVKENVPKKQEIQEKKNSKESKRPDSTTKGNSSPTS